jgi:signal transduction histidine kinase
MSSPSGWAPARTSGRRRAAVASWVFDLPGRLGRASALAVVVGTLCAGWLAVYALGGAEHFSPQWFYLPVILGAVRFRAAGRLTVAIAAAVVAGPMLPMDVRLAQAQPAGIWLTRGLFFVLIAAIVGALVDRIRTSLERELELAREERDLARVQGEVTARVSHEFRTPLTVIKGVVRTLETRELDPRESRELLAGLAGAAERLEDLVAMVTAAAEDPSKVDVLDAREISLAESLRRVGNRLPGLDATTRLSLRPASEAIRLRTDRLAFERILRELVENALKFSPRAAPVSVWAERSSAGIEVHVADDGPGVDDAMLERVFDPFVRGDTSLTSVTDGLGMGLPAAATLARQLGGALVLRRRDGGGTEAMLTLPAEAAP